ncbi:MAG: GNAT family N-acetyltransferase [Sulfitobacter sp.]
MTPAPIIKTDRLILRAPQPSDFDAYAAFMADPRSAMTGGPLERPAAWRSFASELGHWIIRDYGLMTLVTKDSGDIAGQVGFWNPEGWPEVELGWRLYNGFEGKGLAVEAATAALDFAANTMDWQPMISVIAPGNERSIRLAERLGARLERDDWHTPSGKPTLIYRHAAADARVATGKGAAA